MVVDEQIAVSDFLKSLPCAGQSSQAPTSAEIMETHISRLFLAGKRVFKLKRAVKLPYVDFSTPELRLEACQKEVAFNAPSAPGLYLGAHKIVRDAAGILSLDGEGELIDAAIEMVRFSQDALLDSVAQAGGLTPQLMTETVRRIALFHAQTPVARNESGAANIAGVLDINEAGFATSNVFSADELLSFHQAFRDRLQRHSALLDKRAENGKVRRCHGDLHLRNIFLQEGVPCLFDCIEFNDKIATVDVLYDIAFLLMDLWHRDLPDLTNLAANRYLDFTDNDDGFVLLPFFMAIRAAVRAHITATLVVEGGHDPETLVREARSYFRLAIDLLQDSPPQLIAIGGFSGSGKSTVADLICARIVPPPGARLIESDRRRKALHGVPVETRLGAEAYRSEVSDQVYAEMARLSHEILAAGGSVVADAVFNGEARRRLVEESAGETGAAFSGFWLDLPDDELAHRVAARRQGASDATLEVLAQQIAAGTGKLDWRHLDAARPADQIVADILQSVAGSGQSCSISGETKHGQ
jgi:uncharacterized protein